MLTLILFLIIFANLFMKRRDSLSKYGIVMYGPGHFRAINSAQDISAQQTRRRSNPAQVKPWAGQTWRKSNTAQVKIGAGQNWHRKK